MMLVTVMAECQQMVLEAHCSMQEEQVEKLEDTRQERIDASNDDVLQQYDSFQSNSTPWEKPWSQDANA